MKKLPVLSIVLVTLGFLIVGCTFPATVAPTATQIPSPTATETRTARTSTAAVAQTPPVPTPTATSIPRPHTPTPTATATSRPEVPSPTATPTAPPWQGPQPLVSWDDLSFYKSAMLPRFVGDVNWVERTLHPTHYQLDLSLKWPNGIEGTEIVRYTNTEGVPLDRIYFRLFPNIPGWGSKTTVEKVWLDGKVAEWKLENFETALAVLLPARLPVGRSATIALKFSVKIPPGDETPYAVFGYKDGVLSLAHFYPMIPAFDSRGWHIEIPASYGDLTYSDTSFYYIELKSDDPKLQIAASGKVLRHDVGNGQATWVIASGPMRDVNVILSPDFETASEDVNGTTIESYFLKSHESGGKRVLKYASASFRYYSSHFGRYPFRDLDVVESGTTAGGVEYPGLVVISGRYYPEIGGFLEFATAHEVGHQWWYSLVGNDQVNHPWLDESLTNYSTYLYERDAHGDEVGKKVFKDFFLTPYELAGDKKDLPIGLPVNNYDERTYWEIVYGKGPMFFDALRKQVGDDVFFRILQTYFARYKYRIAAPKDFLKVASEVSGKDLTPLFDQWGAK